MGASYDAGKSLPTSLEGMDNTSAGLSCAACRVAQPWVKFPRNDLHPGGVRQGRQLNPTDSAHLARFRILRESKGALP